MATALIKFAQGGPFGPSGVAQKGVTGAAVTVANDSNVGVDEWVVILLDAPSNSVTYPPAANPQVLAQAVSATPLANFTPDVPGEYRILLDVLESGARDRDIRCFGVDDGEGYCYPAYQKNPDPLPLTPPVIVPAHLSPAAKPDEQNYSGQKRGFAGSGSDGQVDQILRTHRDMRYKYVAATPYNISVTEDPPQLLVRTVTIGGACVLNAPATPRVGQCWFVQDVEGGNVQITVNLPGGHSFYNLFGNPSSYAKTAPFQRVGIAYLGGASWLWLNANIQIINLPIFTNVEVRNVAVYDRICSFVFDGVEWDGAYFSVDAVMETTNALVSADFQIYNRTAGAAVVASALSTSNLTPTLLSATGLQVGVDFTNTKDVYEVQIKRTGGGGGDNAICSYAQLTLYATKY